MKTFEEMLDINVNDKTEKSNGFTYLSWAFAWEEFKKANPEAKYTIKKFDSKPYIYDKDLGYMVFTEVSVGDETHEMWLPVMNGANKAMKDESYTYETKYATKEVEKASMFDINKTIMRCLVKNLAMFGLGLYIYAGEDLPSQEVIKKNAAKDMLQKTIKKYGAEEVTPIAKELGISSATITEEEVRLIEKVLVEKEKEQKEKE